MYNLNFFSLFFGRVFTNFADSLYKVLTAWLLYQITGNVAISGVGAAIITIPEILAFLIGPIIDRSNKRNLLLLCTFGQIAGLLVLLALHLTDNLNAPLLVLVMFVITSFNTPTYFIEQSMLPNVVTNRSHMVTANSLFNISYEGIDLIFNAISGFIIALASLTVVIISNIGVYAVALVLFALIKLTVHKKTEKSDENEESFDEGINPKTFISELKDSWRIMMLPELLPTILPVLAFNTVFAGIFVSFPYLASQVGDARYYGLILAAVSVGTFIGAIMAPFLSSRFTISQLVIVPGGLMLLALVLLYFYYDHFYLSLILFTLIFIESGIGNIVLPTYNQMILPENYIGRVSSSIGSLITIGMPIGYAIGGAVVQYTSFKWMVLIVIIVQIWSFIYWMTSKPFRSLSILDDIKPLNLK